MRLSGVARTAALAGLLSEYDNGYIRVFTGPRPAEPDTAIIGQVLLAELRFDGGFAVRGAGEAVAEKFVEESSVRATGEAAWFRCYRADGVTALHDGSVGVAAADMQVPTVDFTAGARLWLDSFTLVMPAGE